MTPTTSTGAIRTFGDWRGAVNELCLRGAYGRIRVSSKAWGEHTPEVFADEQPEDAIAALQDAITECLREGNARAAERYFANLADLIAWQQSDTAQPDPFGFAPPASVVNCCEATTGGDVDYITVTEAAHELGVSRQRVNVLIRSKRLPAEKCGAFYLIRPQDLELVRERRTGRPRKLA